MIESGSHRHQWAVLTTATVTGADTIHAFPSIHLINDYVSALLKSFADASGIIKGDRCIVPRGSGNGGDGKVVSVNEDRISISVRQSNWSARAENMTGRV